MSSDVIRVLVGIWIGLALAYMLCITPISTFVKKDTLRAKQTINMNTCYAQYSAVRRFPK